MCVKCLACYLWPYIIRAIVMKSKLGGVGKGRRTLSGCGAQVNENEMAMRSNFELIGFALLSASFLSSGGNNTMIIDSK